MAKQKNEEVYTPLLPVLVDEVTLEWADSKALGLPAMYANGESFSEVCRDLGISKEQYKQACKISDKFNSADKYSQVVHEAWWMKTGREGAAGKRINGAIFNHTMNNRYGWSNGGGNDDDGNKGRTLNLGIVFMGTAEQVGQNTVNSVIDSVMTSNKLTLVSNVEDEI